MEYCRSMLRDITLIFIENPPQVGKLGMSLPKGYPMKRLRPVLLLILILFGLVLQFGAAEA